MVKNKKILIIALFVIIICAGSLFIYFYGNIRAPYTSRNVIEVLELPEPEIDGEMSVEEAIQSRRSVRRYTNESLHLKDVSQLLWAAQGITDPERKFRTAPSAGRTYPLEVYIVVGNGSVSDLDQGVYHYNPINNTLEKFLEGDLRSSLSEAAHGQPSVKQAPVDIIITAVYERTTNKYGELGERFVHMEAGHAGENIYLEATSRNLATVSIGSFYDDQMEKLLKLPSNEKPLYIFPVGHPAS